MFLFSCVCFIKVRLSFIFVVTLCCLSLIKTASNSCRQNVENVKSDQRDLSEKVSSVYGSGAVI